MGGWKKKRIYYEEVKDKNKKRCGCCKLIKNKHDFYKSDYKEFKDGYRTDCKECVRNKYLYYTYGITSEQYNQLLKDQNYDCAICGLNEDDSEQNFHLDHDHSNGKIRGILCENCNHGIGNFNDNIEIMASAISYLQQEAK